MTKSQGGAPGQFVGKSNWGVIARCYAYNTAAHGSQRIYNMVGSGTVKATDCYYLGEAAKEGAGIKALSSEQMQSRESYAGFDFSGVWTMDAGDNGFVIGYACPQLQGSPQRYEVEAYFAGGGTDPSARDIWEEDVDENKSSGGITEMEVKDDNGRATHPPRSQLPPQVPPNPRISPRRIKRSRRAARTLKSRQSRIQRNRVKHRRRLRQRLSQSPGPESRRIPTPRHRAKRRREQNRE